MARTLCFEQITSDFTLCNSQPKMHHLQNKDNYLWVYAENSGTKLVVVGLQLFRFLHLFFHWFLSKIFVQEARELNSVNGYDICNHFTLVQFKMLFWCAKIFTQEYLLLSVVRIPWYFCDVLASKVGLPGGLVHEDLLTFERALLIFLSFSCFFTHGHFACYAISLSGLWQGYKKVKSAIYLYKLAGPQQMTCLHLAIPTTNPLQE